MLIGFLSHSDMSIYHFRLSIMRALKERGHKVYAIAPNGAYTDKIAREFTCVHYDINRASTNPFRVGRDALKLAKVLAPLHLDMLQSAAHKSNVFGLSAAKMIGIKYAFGLVEGLGSAYTNDDFKSKALRYIIEMLYKNALKSARACIFVNDADAQYFRDKKLIAPQKIRKIKSVGVDASEFDPTKVQASSLLAPLAGKKIVLMMGRALKDKGVREFYEAANLLAARDDAAFVFVGSADMGNKSCLDDEFLKSSKNVTHIAWSDDVAALLKGAYIYALPSYREGFPRTILEAMSMGKACVASDVAGCNEAVINERTGLLCKLKDSADLARKIELLLDDENKASEYGTNARQIVLANYDEPIITDKYIQVYKEFLDV